MSNKNMDNKDVHTEHCCARHGCKYGIDGFGEHDGCSVVSGRKKQSFPCEMCEMDPDPLVEKVAIETNPGKDECIIDATNMTFPDVMRLAETHLYSGARRVTVMADGESVMVLDRYSDYGSCAFWRPGRAIRKSIQKVLDENPGELEKFRKGKKLRTVRNFLLDKLDRELQGRYDADYAYTVINEELRKIKP